ncbi:M23 family metallopeptidase [Cohnella caldifontis]|uniref:M23 family metallopeptidase n=1 Tax=Cohnella caldifontis TaxID=3027471 RepID=UPI0023EC40B6|nr:M23 family metallopeptidase [Cohnella sp. YIM B05605]
MQVPAAHFFRNHRKPVWITVAAVVGVAAFAAFGQQYVKAHTQDYVQVYWKGQPIGNASSGEKIEQWLAAKAAELDQAETPIRRVLDDGQVTYEREKAYKPATDDEAVLADLEQRLTTHPVGMQVKVDGQVVGVVRDRAAADELLDRIKNRYVPEGAKLKQVAMVKSAAPKLQSLAYSASNAAPADEPASASVPETDPLQPQTQIVSIGFEENVDLEEVGLAESGGALSDPDQLYKKLVTGNPAPVRYTVKKGDCLGCIADKMNVPTDLIYQNNPWIEDDMIRIGDVLDLTVQQPVLNVRSTQEVTQVEAIESPVQYQKSDEMRAGQTKVLRQGKDGKKRVTYRQVLTNGSLDEEEIVSEQILEQAVPTIILKGTKVIKGEGTGKFMWPVAAHRITSYLGERWGRTHKGIDMIGKSTIMAADSGVVEFAGYNSGGLGNAVIINHKNGFKTVYGHMKKLNVKKGQIVEKGDPLGVMGSTGHSTGTHLHFEVYLNGKLKNPISYL